MSGSPLYGVKIVATEIRPPIPARNFDWQAYVDGSIDVCGDPECRCRENAVVGYGATEAEAIADLREQLEASE